jgi:4-hydroxybenzoate polyprenyltransferase
MSTRKTNTFFLKIISLLSVVRGYNILVIIAAQYLAAIFIFSENKYLRETILDKHLFFIIIATVCVVAAGYIINNFYDVLYLGKRPFFLPFTYLVFGFIHTN